MISISTLNAFRLKNRLHKRTKRKNVLETILFLFLHVIKYRKQVVYTGREGRIRI